MSVTYVCFVLLLGVLAHAYVFDEPTYPDFTADFEFSTPGRLYSGIRIGKMYYSYTQGAYRVNTSKFEELYTFDLPKQRPQFRISSCGASNCLLNLNLNATVFYNQTDQQFEIVYSFDQPPYDSRKKEYCNVTTLIFNRLSPCVSTVDIRTVSTGCPVNNHTFDASKLTKPCNFFEGIGSKTLSVQVCNTGAVTRKEIRVKMRGAVPGDGFLSLITNPDKTKNLRCGTIQTTTFVCPTDLPQLKFSKSKNCSCELGEPVPGGFPKLWNSQTFYETGVVDGAGCSEYKRTSIDTNPVNTLYFNKVTKKPCGAIIGDPTNDPETRWYTFTNVIPKTKPFTSLDFAAPTKCNCSTPLDIEVVVNPSCSFFDFDNLRAAAWEFLSTFDLGDRFTRVGLWRPHKTSALRKLLKLILGITRTNVFSSIFSFTCCNLLSYLDDDIPCCYNENQLSDTILDAAEDLLGKNRSYEVNQAIVVFTSDLTDPGIPGALVKINRDLPKATVYFVTLLQDFQVTFPTNISNYKIWKRTDWLYWRRLPYQLLGSICAQSQQPCGQGCCGECLCKQCLDCDKCPLYPGDGSTGNNSNVCIGTFPTAVSGCCQVSSAICDTNANLTAQCKRSECNSTIGQCVISSTCSNLNTFPVSNVFCNGNGKCVGAPASNLTAQINQTQQGTNVTGSKNCQTVIVQSNNLAVVVTSAICKVPSDDCNLTKSYCAGNNVCVTEPLPAAFTQNNDKCKTYQCAGTTPSITFQKECPDDNSQGNVGMQLPFTVVINGNEQTFNVGTCDGNTGACNSFPDVCRFGEVRNNVTGVCQATGLPQTIDNLCKNRTGYVGIGIQMGVCVYAPAACPVSSCRSEFDEDNTGPNRVTMVQINATYYECHDVDGGNLGTIYKPTNLYSDACSALCLGFTPTTTINCNNVYTECRIGTGPLVGGWAAQPSIGIYGNDGPLPGTTLCYYISQANPLNLCFDPSAATTCSASGQCTLTPRPFPPANQCEVVVFQQVETAPGSGIFNCNITRPAKTCDTAINQCYNYRCDSVYGCVAEEKCVTTFCTINACANASTGACAPIAQNIPYQYQSPCYKNLVCNENAHTWSYDLFCDDLQDDTIDICDPDQPEATRCSYLCDDKNYCTTEVYNPVTQQCVYSTNPDCFIAGQSAALQETAVIKANNCNNGNRCQVGSLDANGDCVFQDYKCPPVNDPCNDTVCEPTLGCISVRKSCNDTLNPSTESCMRAYCDQAFVNGAIVGVCVTEPVKCVDSVLVVTVVASVLGVGAIVGIVIAGIVVVGGATTTAYYVKLNIAPEEEPETNWNDAYDKDQGNNSRRGGANPVHRRH